jgi:multiple sugar transport system ATP-binding protein
MARIDIRQLGKQFGEQTVIQGVDLEIADGEFMVFVGPSGCGKSTMMRMLAGLESPSLGSIFFDGIDVTSVPPAERGAAMVFQSYALYPHMTVAENMAFGLRMAGTPKAEREALVRQIADKLQLTELMERYPKQLSGGQRQRVAIGRAIVRRPKVFLFDEPLSNLDAALRVQMRIELARLHTDLGTTMVYVTHDQTEAMTLGHRIAVFNNGRIEQVGPPLVLYRSPVNRFVAEFLGSPKINVLPYQWQPDASVRVGAQTLCDLNLSTQALERLRKGASLGIRPEAFHLSADGQGWAGELGFVENLGDVQMAYVRCEGLEEWLRVKVNAPGMALVAGQKVCCCPDMAQCLVMDADGRVIP